MTRSARSKLRSITARRALSSSVNSSDGAACLRAVSVRVARAGSPWPAPAAGDFPSALPPGALPPDALPPDALGATADSTTALVVAAAGGLRGACAVPGGGAVPTAMAGGASRGSGASWRHAANAEVAAKAATRSTRVLFRVRSSNEPAARPSRRWPKAVRARSCARQRSSGGGATISRSAASRARALADRPGSELGVIEGPSEAP